MKTYRIKADGFEYDIQLSDEEAKRLGIEGMHVDDADVSAISLAQDGIDGETVALTDEEKAALDAENGEEPTVKVKEATPANKSRKASTK